MKKNQTKRRHTKSLKTLNLEKQRKTKNKKVEKRKKRQKKHTKKTGKNRGKKHENSQLATIVIGNELGPGYPFHLKQLKYEDP